MEDSNEVSESADQNEKEDELKPQDLPLPQETILNAADQPAWKSGLCACCNNPLNALVTVLCPCLTVGQIAEMVDEGHIACCTSLSIYLGMWLLCGFSFGMCCACKNDPCRFTLSYRSKLRKKFNLPESPAQDWFVHLCCHCCALCQEYRELQSRGFDPSLGWKKNLARNRGNQQQTMEPPPSQRMPI